MQPAKVVLKGYRSVVEDDATCYEVAESKQMGEELQRRARVIARGLRGVGTCGGLQPVPPPVALLPDHLAPLAALGRPFFLIVAFVANAFLLDAPFYQLTFALQLAFYARPPRLAPRRRRVRLPGLFVPLYFCLVNLAPLIAVWSLLKGEKKIVWETGRPVA